MMRNYEPMSGMQAREVLNSLGYDVRSSDEFIEAVMGMLVALAREIKPIAEAIRQEREACAKICDKWADDYPENQADTCAKEIRDRA